MNYIVSEEELSEILVQGWKFRRLIKSKQVELVAEGRVKKFDGINKDYKHIKIGGDTVVAVFCKLETSIKKNYGQNIEIYIQKKKQ